MNSRFAATVAASFIGASAALVTAPTSAADYYDTRVGYQTFVDWCTSQAAARQLPDPRSYRPEVRQIRQGEGPSIVCGPGHTGGWYPQNTFILNMDGICPVGQRLQFNPANPLHDCGCVYAG